MKNTAFGAGDLTIVSLSSSNGELLVRVGNVLVQINAALATAGHSGGRGGGERSVNLGNDSFLKEDVRWGEAAALPEGTALSGQTGPCSSLAVGPSAGKHGDQSGRSPERAPLCAFRGGGGAGWGNVSLPARLHFFLLVSRGWQFILKCFPKGKAGRNRRAVHCAPMWIFWASANVFRGLDTFPIHTATVGALGLGDGAPRSICWA